MKHAKPNARPRVPITRGASGADRFPQITAIFAKHEISLCPSS